MTGVDLGFSAELFEWRGPAPFYWLTIPEDGCESIRAEAAGARVGRLLKISARAPVLSLQRKAFGTDGAAKEIGRVWFCSDSYQFVCSAGSVGSEGSLFDIRNIGERV